MTIELCISFPRQTMGEEKGQETKPEEKDEMEETIEDKDVKIAQKNKPSQRSYRQRRDSEPIEEDSNNDSISKASASSAEDSDNEIAHGKNVKHIFTLHSPQGV